MIYNLSRPKERLGGSPPICNGNKESPKKVSTKKKDWDTILDLQVKIT
jgi:ribosomal protein L25 (general stress protein Ctc)